MRNPFIPKKEHIKFESIQGQSKGILNDEIVGKDVQTVKGQVYDTPVNAHDLVNKEYADSLIAEVVNWGSITASGAGIVVYNGSNTVSGAVQLEAMGLTGSWGNVEVSGSNLAIWGGANAVSGAAVKIQNTGLGSPVGSIIAWVGVAGTDITPSGWLICDGTSYLQASYPELYALIGNRFGGNETNFNVPNLELRYLKNITFADPESVGNTAGAEIHQHAEISAGIPTGNIDMHTMYVQGLGGMFPNAVDGPSVHTFEGDTLAPHEHAAADHNPCYMLVVWLIKA